MIGANSRNTMNVTNRLKVNGHVVEKKCHSIMKITNRIGTASV